MTLNRESEEDTSEDNAEAEAETTAEDDNEVIVEDNAEPETEAVDGEVTSEEVVEEEVTSEENSEDDDAISQDNQDTDGDSEAADDTDDDGETNSDNEIESVDNSDTGETDANEVESSSDNDSIDVDGTTSTSVETFDDGNKIAIKGETVSEGNLFHSFSKFDLESGKTANFVSKAEINNILARVTGDNPSLIDGTIEVTEANSNLFFINPAGIVFGSNSTLNLPASFTASTASSFVGAPDPLGAIINAGDITVGSGTDINGEDITNNGETINLVGGSVVNTGDLQAPSGNINLAAVTSSQLKEIEDSNPDISGLSTEAEAFLAADSESLNGDRTLSSLLADEDVADATGLEVTDDGSIQITDSDTSISSETGTVFIAGALNADDLYSQASQSITFSKDTLVEVEPSFNPQFIGTLINPEDIPIPNNEDEDSTPILPIPLEDIPIFNNLTFQVDPEDGQTGSINIEGSFAVTNELNLENSNGDIIINPTLPDEIEFNSGTIDINNPDNGSIFIGIESLLFGIEPNGEARNNVGLGNIKASQGSVILDRGIALNAGTDLTIEAQRLDASGTTTLGNFNSSGSPESSQQTSSDAELTLQGLGISPEPQEYSIGALYYGRQLENGSDIQELLSDRIDFAPVQLGQ